MAERATPPGGFPPVLFEDDYLLVVDKPAGLLVIPSPKGETRTLGSLVNEYLASKAAGPGSGQDREGQGHAAAWPCHRIDRETSGVMVYAKGKAMQKRVMALFEERQVKKTYLALVNGRPGKAAGSLRQPIDGQDAVTNYQVMAACDDFAALRVMPVTGRTNQIRIHCARMGHPLLGDAKFGLRKEFRVPCKRTALHAWRLEMIHPVSGQALVFEAPIPADLALILEPLRSPSS